jgi:tetratricopeptide (TPR) repeat protein
MVDLPLHNFVRWRLSDADYLDFETMDGKITDDLYYRSVWHIPANFVGTPGVLTTMTMSQLRAYHDFTIAIALTYGHNYPDAIVQYRRSISTDSTLSEAPNNLAWLYTVVPTPALRNSQEAVVLAKKAVSILPSGDSLDTLACAYGLSGNFPAAIASESRAIGINWAPQGSNITGDMRRLSEAQPCEDPMFGNDPHPFRPGTLVKMGILSKDANAVH